jgi:hypothetical protein
VELARDDKFSITDLGPGGFLEFLVKVSFKRERVRQNHTFSDAEQHQFLELIALDMLHTGTGAYEMEDLEVFALEAADPRPLLGEDPNVRKLSKLLSHHFLSFEEGGERSHVAAIKHEVWRDYFQETLLPMLLPRRMETAS